MKGYRKVLIAMNGSKEVLRQGIKLAQEEKTWVTVVKVVQPYEGDLNLTGIKNLNDVLDDGGSRAISDINRIAASEGVLVKTRLESGDVPDRIVEVAAEEKCDLIIMGSKKKKGILSQIFGDHVVEKVIDRAPCPVFVVGV
ncbi:MAG TPA: universal stress protein [Nitrospirota bacterium]|jgi:nucleotide-binding universal stress UspA family protein|nr:universal stress protein [Nitrospirota bacterium]